VGILMRA